MGIPQQNSYLVCVNNEEYSEAALLLACDMAKKDNGSIILLHVIEPSEFQSIGVIAEKMRQEQHTESQNLLNHLAAKATSLAGIKPRIEIREGLIENEIIAAIEHTPGIKMLVTGASQEHAKKSKIIPVLIAAIGSKLHIPILIVPGELPI